MKLADDGYCFVCGPRNPIGLRLDFVFDGTSVRAAFIPRKEHQGYLDIVHGGIISTLLDEAMVKLAIALDMPAVTAHMEIRLRKALRTGERVTVTAEIVRDTKKLLLAHARARTDDDVLIADAQGKLLKMKT